MPLQNPTNNYLIVTKPAELDSDTDRGFREIERYTNNHPGLPAGGTTGQVLEKNSGTNYDVSWQTPSGGGATVRPVTDTIYINGGHFNCDGYVSRTLFSFQYTGTNPPWMDSSREIILPGLYQN